MIAIRTVCKNWNSFQAHCKITLAYSLWSEMLLFNCSVVSNFSQPHTVQHTRLLCPPPSHGVGSNSCPLSHWCYLTISSSAGPFSFCFQSFSASGSFPVSQLFTSSGQNTGASASASVLPMDIQGWFPLEWTSLISLQSKGLSGDSSSTAVRRH